MCVSVCLSLSLSLSLSPSPVLYLVFQHTLEESSRHDNALITTVCPGLQ